MAYVAFHPKHIHMLQSLFLSRTEHSFFLFEEDLIPWAARAPSKQHKFWPQQKMFPQKVCSHCVSRRTLHLHAMVPLLHPSKVTLEELTGGFKYTRWLNTIYRCANMLANHPCPSLHNTAESQNTTAGPWGWLGNFCVCGDVSRVIGHHW